MNARLRQVVSAEFELVDHLIASRISSRIPVVENVGRYILSAGGKRLRPLLVLLAGRACGGDGQKLATMAAVIEFLHTATLLHDDVVDGSTLRRGMAAAHTRWSDSHSILVGDFLYSRAFQMMLDIGLPAVLNELADSSNELAEGEVLQLETTAARSLDEADYFRVIKAKTARLFEAAAVCGALVAQGSDEQADALRIYGRHLGMAYQLVDDILDYSGDTSALGKNQGDDLANGRLTLPIIKGLELASEDERKIIRRALTEGANGRLLSRVTAIIKSCGSLEACYQVANEELEVARAQLDKLPASEFRDSLNEFTHFTATRSN